MRISFNIVNRYLILFNWGFKNNKLIYRIRKIITIDNHLNRGKL